MRTFLAWTLRVTISPWNSLPNFLKDPMVAMSFLLWLFEPATIAASMAIDSRRRLTLHPLGAGAQRRMAAEGLCCLARNGCRRGSPRLRGGKPRGRKSRRRHCGKAIEACRPVARSRHQEAARVARGTAAQGEDMADMGPCKSPGFKGEGTETLAYRKAA